MEYPLEDPVSSLRIDTNVENGDESKVFPSAARGLFGVVILYRYTLVSNKMFKYNTFFFHRNLQSIFVI